MKVYVVIREDRFGDRIARVFSEEEAAKNCAEYNEERSVVGAYRVESWMVQ